VTVTEKLKSLLTEQYISEDGDEYKIELLPGLTDQEIDNLAQSVPSGQIPNDIKELLEFASGFEFGGLEEITFNGVGQFGLEEIFPYSVQLAGDRFGNFWILDIDQNGNWGHVFYVCHEPSVIVKHSENLIEFLQHIDDFGKNGSNSNLDIIHEKSVMEVWQDDKNFIEYDNAIQSNDKTLKEFALSLTDNFVISDLRKKPNISGFALDKFGSKIEKVKRHQTELLWAFEKPEKKKGLLSRIFGG
jgi:hypothetical protein